MPNRCNILEQAARVVDPTAKVWLRHSKQELPKTAAEHSKFLLKIPEVRSSRRGMMDRFGVVFAPSPELRQRHHPPVREQ